MSIPEVWFQKHETKVAFSEMERIVASYVHC